MEVNLKIDNAFSFHPSWCDRDHVDGMHPGVVGDVTLAEEVWVTGPGNEPWEVYVVKGDADTLDKPSGSVCCAPAAEADATAQPASAACC